MVSIRKVVLATGEIYHIYNRGVERRTIFSNKREYQKALDTLSFYHHSHLPIRFSHFINLKDERKNDILIGLKDVEATILAYCLIPNHFHFLLKQEKDNGISRLLSNFSNSYCKYFNTKHQRIGPLFQGTFKAVRVETDEQLIHLSRYIHLNPVSAFLVKENLIDNYEWSSLPEYLILTKRNIADTGIILNHFKDRKDYRNFVHDKISYSKELKKINHLIQEDV